MGTVMLQFKHAGRVPTIDDVCGMFQLSPHELDAKFGVLSTDPMEGLYAVLIDDAARSRVEAALAKRPPDPAEGIFANPTIEPFGPPTT